jgi:penicillin-binding protein 2
MVVENAGFGAASAAPIARRIFDYLLLGKYPSAEDIAATQLGQSSVPIGSARDPAEVPLPGMSTAAPPDAAAPDVAGAASSAQVSALAASGSSAAPASAPSPSRPPLRTRGAVPQQ